MSRKRLLPARPVRRECRRSRSPDVHEIQCCPIKAAATVLFSTGQGASSVATKPSGSRADRDGEASVEKKRETPCEVFEGAVYALVLASRDGRRGQQLRSTPQDCVAWLTAHGLAGMSQPALTDPP